MMVAYPPAVVGPFVQPVPLHDHIAFLTPVGESISPAKDVLSFLKTNTDPSKVGIGQVTLRSTRLGVTVSARNKLSLGNLKKAIEQSSVT